MHKYFAMSQKLQVNNFYQIKDTSQSNKDFIESYNEKCDKGYFLEADVQYTETLLNLHNNLPFLLFLYVIHISNLKEALDHGLDF